jgi:hypothetical protein
MSKTLLRRKSSTAAKAINLQQTNPIRSCKANPLFLIAGKTSNVKRRTKRAGT